LAGWLIGKLPDWQVVRLLDWQVARLAGNSPSGNVDDGDGDICLLASLVIVNALGADLEAFLVRDVVAGLETELVAAVILPLVVVADDLRIRVPLTVRVRIHEALVLEALVPELVGPGGSHRQKAC